MLGNTDMLAALNRISLALASNDNFDNHILAAISVVDLHATRCAVTQGTTIKAWRRLRCSRGFSMRECSGRRVGMKKCWNLESSTHPSPINHSFIRTPFRSSENRRRQS